jgi:dTDP-glucose pyrophosphorylase
MFNTQLLINKNFTIKEALRRLDETAEKVLFVVDNENKLIGALTDGDVRRYLLSGESLQGDISGIFNTKPKFIYKNKLVPNEVKELFIKHKLTLLPVLDSNNRISQIINWSSLFSKGEHIEIQREKVELPVVIMAGGKGARLDPFTKILPKPLIPIGDKPIIEIIIDKFLEFGVSDFYITLNHKGRMIKAYFEDLNPSYKITYIEERKPLGTAGGLKYLQDTVVDNLIVSNSDIIIEEDYSEILKFHNEMKNDITLVASVKHYNVPYGICDIENGGKLAAIREKPDFSFLVNTGMYILNSKVINVIPSDERYHMTQLIHDIKNSSGKVGVYPVSESSWVDIGELASYKKTLEKIGYDN